MPTVPPPDDVVRLLHALGARPASPVGTDGSWWVARPLDDADDRWLEVQVLDAPADATLAARAATLLALDHPHLPRVRAVEPLAPGRVAVVCEHVPGPSVAAVRAARPPLADGEVVTLAVPVAQALGALHAAGLAHGAVGADRVVVRPGGMPVLVDLRGALRGDGTPTGDVHRLLATLLGLMAPLDAHLAAGLDGTLRLRDALERLLRTPAVAGDVVDAAFASAEAEPLLVPEPDALAGAQVALAHGRTAAPRERAGDPAPPRRSRRARPPRRRSRGAVGAVVAVVAVLLGGGAWGVHAVTGDGEAPTAGTADAPPSPGAADGSRVTTASDDRGDAAVRDPEDPAGAAAALTRLRADALAAADAGGLAELSVPGSAAAAADAEVVAALAGARSDGLVVDVAAVTTTGRTSDGDATVEVTSALGPHVRVTPEGERADVPAAPSRTVELVLRWADGRWRVLDVREPGGASS